MSSTLCSAVCIIGNTVNTNLFRGGSPIGSRIRIGGISCDVIGLLSSRGQAGFGGDQDDVVLMPLKTVQRRFTGSTDLRLILVGVDPAYATSTVQASIEDMMRERRNINGGLTLGENIGDLGGVEAAYTAYQRYQEKHGKAPVIDGLTGDQRFFLAYAQAWQAKVREGAQRTQLLTDPHSPAKFRVNGIVRNVDARYKAFNT
eukprot:gene25930-33897_t